MTKEKISPIVTSGPEKGRVADVVLAEEMAYAEKPHRDYIISDERQYNIRHEADAAMLEIREEFPDISEKELAEIALKTAIEIDADEKSSVLDAERASERVLQVHYRKRVENQRAKNYKKPTSAGLPTLGKR